MTEMVADDFEWAWAQVPDIKIIEMLELNNFAYRPWDRRWIYAGPLFAPFCPTTLCPCENKLPGRLIELRVRVNCVNDQTGKQFRLAFGECQWCGTIYWQTDDAKQAVGP